MWTANLPPLLGNHGDQVSFTEGGMGLTSKNAHAQENGAAQLRVVNVGQDACWGGVGSDEL